MRFLTTPFIRLINPANRIVFTSANRFPTIAYQCRLFSYSGVRSTSKNYYELLELPTYASIKDIKRQFKSLSKKFHPDLNTHLSEADKESNNEKFVNIVSAYDTLKDIKKKKQYDRSLKDNTGHLASNYNSAPSSQWHNEYYGEAKYYSKSGSKYTASGYNYTRHRVHNFGDHGNNSTFSGRHKNYGDRYDVPHFNYDEHLSKHLKFEQRIINKQLSDEDRQAIIKQLSKTGDTSNISEELITKHLMRQIHHSYNKTNNQNSFAPQATNLGTNTKNPYMYHGPHDEGDGMMFRSLMFLGGLGSICLLYNALS